MAGSRLARMYLRRTATWLSARSRSFRSPAPDEFREPPCSTGAGRYMRTGLSVAICWLALLPASAAPPLWHMVWSDEFNGPPGTPPDPSKWVYDLGGGGWGNQELEVYTDNRGNALQDGRGNLVIQALERSPGQFTSARLKTQ